MSKILYPSLRLGYVVAPEQLIDSLVKIRSTMDQHSSPIDQATLARFINEGFFLSHIRRMRKLYAERREFFMKEFNKLLGNRFILQTPEAGLNFVAWLRSGTDIAKVARVCTDIGIKPSPLSFYCIEAKLQARVCFRFCCLDARANSRKPPEACICAQVTTRILAFIPLCGTQARRRPDLKHLAFVLPRCHGLT